MPVDAPAPDLTALGWDAGHAAALAASGGDRPARVSRVDRGWIDVLAAEGRLRLELHPEGPAPVTGDWIAVDAPGTGVAVLLPRRTALLRTDADAGSAQVVAANVDVVAIVVPADRPLNARRLERAAVVAVASGARAVVVVTKLDVAADIDALRTDVAAIVRLPALSVSATTGLGLGRVRGLAPAGRTLALLGASGVGKSTLANRLVGADLQATGPLRDDGSGRHTTTARQLLRLPGGGSLIDTPGVRSLGVWDAADAVAVVFAEVEALASRCRFGDCGHAGEPGCAVGAAVDTGALDPDREAAWRALTAEAAATADLATDLAAGPQDRRTRLSSGRRRSTGRRPRPTRRSSDP